MGNVLGDPTFRCCIVIDLVRRPASRPSSLLLTRIRLDKHPPVKRTVGPDASARQVRRLYAKLNCRAYPSDWESLPPAAERDFSQLKTRKDSHLHHPARTRCRKNRLGGT